MKNYGVARSTAAVDPGLEAADTAAVDLAPIRTSAGYRPCCILVGIIAASVFSGRALIVVLEKGRAATVLDCACPIQGDTKITKITTNNTKILQKSTEMH